MRAEDFLSATGMPRTGQEAQESKMLGDQENFEWMGILSRAAIHLKGSFFSTLSSEKSTVKILGRPLQRGASQGI
jgi:hypothetical protein